MGGADKELYINFNVLTSKMKQQRKSGLLVPRVVGGENMGHCRGFVKKAIPHIWPLTWGLATIAGA